MSEYQRIAFRAIDKPVSEKNLKFMRQQSSRAEITPWSFDNEYQYGDFGGNVPEMLRRGYDLLLHYADFGIRKLLIRFPQGLPDADAAQPYFAEDALQFLKDKQGPGGILSIEPEHEPGDLEDLWEFDDLLERLLPLRNEILDGDLRPLYLAHLAIGCIENPDSEETIEAPVPAGLDAPSDAQRALAELYGLSDAVIAAAAQGSPRLAPQVDPRDEPAEWLQAQPATTKDAWLKQWMADPHTEARGEMLAEFRKGRGAPSWPTVRRNRTLAALQAAAAEIQTEANRKAAVKSARQRQKRLAGMAADPAQTLRETEQLVKQRGAEAYRQTAELLAELRDALAGSEQADLPEQQAQQLRQNNPTLRKLVSELRRNGFLPK